MAFKALQLSINCSRQLTAEPGLTQRKPLLKQKCQEGDLGFKTVWRGIKEAKRVSCLGQKTELWLHPLTEQVMCACSSAGGRPGLQDNAAGHQGGRERDGAHPALLHDRL